MKTPGKPGVFIGAEAGLVAHRAGARESRRVHMHMRACGRVRVISFAVWDACACAGADIDRTKQNARAMTSSGGLLDISLTMSYFHTGTRTIIGAEAFHFPV